MKDDGCLTYATGPVNWRVQLDVCYLLGTCKGEGPYAVTARDKSGAFFFKEGMLRQKLATKSSSMEKKYRQVSMLLSLDLKVLSFTCVTHQKTMVLPQQRKGKTG